MTKCADRTDAEDMQPGWVAICQLEKGHKGQHSNGKQRWGEEEPAPTDTQVTRVLAEKGLGWELVDAFEPDELQPNPPKEWKGSRGMVPVGDYMTDTSHIFSPLTDLNHAKMVWDALTGDQQDAVVSAWVEKEGAGWHPGDMGGMILNPRTLSMAIYEVLEG